MLDNETKRRIDTARDILVGKVPDPKSQVEQITIALIYKFMDDMDAEAEELGGKRKFFSAEFEKYSWKKLLSPSLSGQEVLNLYAEAIQQMNINSNIPQLFRDIFKNAYLPYRDPETLKSFLKIIDDFNYDHSEKLGDAFEYLLSVLGSQGDAGQFRTPRHIIDFMVYLTDPKKNETILDPACGTAGFLISSYKHIVKNNSSSYNTEQEGSFSFGNGDSEKYKGDKLTPDERKQLAVNIQGFDISPDMVRLSLVNLYLHGFTNPRIVEYDTLTSEEKWNEHVDIILANPPFMSPKGGIKPHKRFSVESKRSEVLFVDYIAEHLTPNGRAAIIVPEGIIFQSGTAYKALRKMLVEKYLYAVVSLPAGVFNPYSGVKTSILLLDKVLARRTDKILFAKIENDGFDLGAQRRVNEKSELPAIANAIKEYVKCVNNNTEFNVDDFKNLVVATKEKIGKNDDWNLSGDRYVSIQTRSAKYQIVSLRDICKVINGKAFSQEELLESGKYPVLRVGNFFSNRSWYYSDLELEEDKYCNAGDLLYAWSASFGPKIWDGEKTIYHYHIWKMIPDENKINKKYLYYVLERDTEEIKFEGGRGIAMMHITKEGMEKRQFPLPPLEIQKEIVEEIEGWQKIIDGARQVVENYKPQIEIDPNWPMVELGELYEIQYGLAESIPENIDEEGIKIISTAETNINGSLDLSKIRKIKYLSKYDKFILQPDTLLFNWRNAPKHVGKTVYFNEITDKYIFASFLLALTKKNNQINSLFYWAYLNKLREDGFFKLMSRQAVNQTNFNGGELAKILIPHPTLDVQNRIVDDFSKEQKLVNSNKELISIFEQKIKDKIAKVWGD